MLLAGCGGTQSTGEFGDVPIVLGDTPTADEAGVYLATERGYDTAEGVTLEPTRDGNADFRLVASPPKGCIAGILAEHPDVVVLDVQLEGGQGLDVLRTVRAADPRIAFVVFSNNSQAAYRKRYLAAGAALFLDKSTEFDQLAAAVDAAPLSSSH